MKEFLKKLNTVNKNNYINKLKKENLQKENRIKRYLDNFKEVITEMEVEKRKNLQTIKELTEKNKILIDENNSYKSIIDRIPKWIIRFFAGKQKIGGYLYGGK